MALDKTKTYKLFWDEENEMWECIRDDNDICSEAFCSEKEIEHYDKNLAPLFAVIQSGLIGEKIYDAFIEGRLFNNYLNKESF